MTTVRNELLGVSLDGRHRLERWLGGGGSEDFFLTSHLGRRAALKLIPEIPSEAEEQLERWRRAAALSHPNLLPLLDFGRAEEGGRRFLFAVFELPDETLSSALEHGPLDEAESRDTWNAAVEGLRYIHSRGLVHGAVDLEHIVAVGSTIKLASDTLREPSPSYTASDDFRALGGLGLQNGPPEPVPVPAPVEAPRRRANMDRRWVYAGIPVLLLAAVFTLRHETRRPAHPAAAPVRPAAAPRFAPAKSTAPAQRAAPAKSTAPAPAPRAAGMEPHGRVFWRTVVYTYSNYRDAERKAERVNGKWPALRAEVFTPKGRNRPPYMVALGGRMTREEAERLRKQARAKGLPRDTFVRNYAE